MRVSSLVFCLVLLAGAVPADSLNVRLLGMCTLPHNYTFDVAASGDYAYVANGDSGLRVISVADPTQPTEVAYFDTPGYAVGVALAGDLAYVADGDSGLRVVSVADPLHPVEVGHCGTSGFARGLALAGDYAYIAAHQGLRVVSVADPSHPNEVGRYDLVNYATDVVVAGNYAYLAGTSDGFWIISVVDPGNPVLVGRCPTPDNAYGVAVCGNYAFVAAEDSGLRVISIVDPAHPVEVGRLVDSLTPVVALALDGSNVCVARGLSGGQQGLRVISVTDPTQPVKVGYHQWGETSVACAGGYAFVGGNHLLMIMRYYGSGLVDSPSAEVPATKSATIVRRALSLPGASSVKTGSLLDVNGRKVLNLLPGANDVSGLPPGVYFVSPAREAAAQPRESAFGRQPSAVVKVIIAG